MGICVILLLLAGCNQEQEKQDVVSPTPLSYPLSTATPTRGSKNPTPTFTPSPIPSPTPSLSSPSDGIPHYTMDIVLNYQDRRMQVTQYVLLDNHTNDVWTEVVFSVPPAHVPNVFMLQATEVTTLRQRRLVTTNLENTMLHVRVPSPIQPGEPVGIYFTYAIQIPYVTPTTWLPEGNLGAGDYVVQVGDWHPTLVPYTDNAWHTWQYHAVGDPTVYDIANYDVHIFADPNMVIAAPGEISQTGSARYFQLSNARTFAFTVSPYYQVIESSIDGIPVLSYFLPAYAEGAQAVIDTASQALPLFSTLYGPYPTSGLVIAQNAYFGSMEYTGFISMSDYAYKAYQKIPSSLLVNLTVHEIAHQWWYGAVGNDQVYEPWLDEAFAKYSELLFYERYYPEVVPWWWENHIDRYNPGGSINASIYGFQNTADYIHQIYSQGARFMGDLRAFMGDAQFFAFVKAYQAYGTARIVTKDDFFTVLESYTDGDLANLVDQYFDLD